MKKYFNSIIVFCFTISIIFPLHLVAQDKLTVSGKAEFVSDYIWRGSEQNSGFSLQPSLTLSYAGFSLNAWGSQSLTKWEEGGAKEFDINLGYTYKNFSITLSDYWWSGINQPYGHYKNAHYFEATICYCISPSFPLSLTWSSMFAGADKNENDDLQASTYISALYPILLPSEISLTPSIGFTPWEGMYYHKTAITDIALKASKNIRLTPDFSLPIFIQAIAAPVYDRTYLLAGFSIGFY